VVGSLGVQYFGLLHVGREIYSWASKSIFIAGKRTEVRTYLHFITYLLDRGYLRNHGKGERRL
jgi:hypothetical protein